ncbi:glutathione S-transferase family protein [Agaribacterium haliotis]|uniref:glutathione S-transferase family protein n=1 Tax=Agaribacterium haliotis TaxID=2013869 RepID=UPI000BB53B5C|nr:glutathione S-transferase N-terminal domain-containing protein [Agaribacterium haliotis]
MQLFYSQTSPFARKVTMFLNYTGLVNDCELVLCSFSSEELRKHNPLGKIPALRNGDLTLFDSELILEYLDDLWTVNGNLSLLRRGSRFYYAERKAAMTANGILDAAVSSMFEKKRDTQPSDYWLERWREAIEQGLDQLQLEHCGSAEKPSMSSFCLASALGYLDFRHPDLNWRQSRPELEQWFEAISASSWFIDTAPPASA